jgi:hypothetical protein
VRKGAAGAGREEAEVAEQLHSTHHQHHTPGEQQHTRGRGQQWRGQGAGHEGKKWSTEGGTSSSLSKFVWLETSRTDWCTVCCSCSFA